MTEEKRKRGRPKKVNTELQKAAESVQFIAPIAEYDAEKLDKIDDEYAAKASKIMHPKLSITSIETPYPSNWDTLGKVAKLQWLTANRQK
jgi:hypothetical protein